MPCALIAAMACSTWWQMPTAQSAYARRAASSAVALISGYRSTRSWFNERASTYSMARNTIPVGDRNWCSPSSNRSCTRGTCGIPASRVSTSCSRDRRVTASAPLPSSPAYGRASFSTTRCPVRVSTPV